LIVFINSFPFVCCGWWRCGGVFVWFLGRLRLVGITVPTPLKRLYFVPLNVFVVLK